MNKIGKKKIRALVDECLKNNNCDVDILYDEPMSRHTSFKVGGPAELYVCPKGDGFLSFSAALLFHAKKSGIPVFILGGGANIVVSDQGIGGIVLDTGAWTSAHKKKSTIFDHQMKQMELHSGTTMDEAADITACAGLSGLEFLAGMPGTIGGAVWMNARCYGSEIADVLAWTDVIDFGSKTEEPVKRKIFTKDEKENFGYKRSPFQGKDYLITAASFNLVPGDKNEIQSKMETNRKDREKKGHYLFPCAGSAFKNNRDFGKPTGQIIDELGLRGLRIGGAQIAPFHGNIVINTGRATAAEIRALMNETAAKVKAAVGFVLEPEIIFVD